MATKKYVVIIIFMIIWLKFSGCFQKHVFNMFVNWPVLTASPSLCESNVASSEVSLEFLALQKRLDPAEVCQHPWKWCASPSAKSWRLEFSVSPQGLWGSESPEWWGFHFKGPSDGIGGPRQRSRLILMQHLLSPPLPGIVCALDLKKKNLCVKGHVIPDLYFLFQNFLFY